MADIRATQSGDFLATSTWFGGVVPGSGDVAFSNTFTVTISDARTVQAISNAAGTGITVGGTFSLLNGCNLTCTNANGVVQGAITTSCVTTTSLGVGSSANIAATIAHTSSTASSSSLTFSTAGTLNITGNISGPSTIGGTAAQALSITGNGTLNLTGNVSGGSLSTTNSFAISLSGGALLNIAGSVTGNNHTALNMTNGTVTITGNVTGGSNTFAAGVTNSGGTLTVNGICQSGSAGPAIGLGSIAQVTRLSGPFLLGASGNITTVQAMSWKWTPTQIPTYMEVATSGGSTKRNLYSADNMPVGGYPVAANVRQSTVYGPSSEFTGTLTVPAASSVALGVATDNTTGTAILTAATVRTALGMASANLDTQLAAIPTEAAPNASTIATAVWAAADKTGYSLTTGERQAIATAVEQSILNESDGQAILNAIVGAIGNTNVDQVALIAAIRADLERNGGMLAGRSTLTAGDVRTELKPELDRIANCSTVETTATTIQDALSG